jgi:hypothetical protein
MTYAAHRRIIDVDSHLFELDDFYTTRRAQSTLILCPQCMRKKA